MAEATAICASAKLAVALSRTAASGFSSLAGVRSEIAAAKEALTLLLAFLRFADMRGGTDELVAAWVKLARDAALELEDVADECCYLSCQGLVRDCANAMAWLALSRRLRKAREKLNQISQLKEQYRIHDAIAFVPPRTDDAVSSSVRIAENARLMEEEEIVGFAAYRKLLLGWLTDEGEDARRALVAVCGMGGVGKTTLVTSVYKELGASHCFDCAAWVAVSQRFTMDLRADLVRKILKEVGVHATDGTDYLSLVADLREHLRNKRYLLVLDDVWHEHLWGDLAQALPDNMAGSRVVITTRSSAVAKAAKPGRTMELEPLPWREGWALFCSTAFRRLPRRECPGHLKELAVGFAERCCGLPLAIVAIGNLLALREPTEFAWRNACNSMHWHRSSGDLGIGEASSILNLSIDDLPCHLKKCFLSCSIYPEDFLIKRKILIRNWVALGFVEEQGQLTMEEAADYYLDQLVQRNLMRVAVRNESGRAKRCLIHDLIRELITLRSREEEGYVQLAKCRLTMDSNMRVRHLALDRCESHNHSAWKMASLRSFHAFGSELDAGLLSSFRLLTVLNLWFIGMDRLPNSVTSLYNLRYLGIRSTLIEKLPEDIGKLNKLQVLDAKWSMVQRLPSSVSKLKSLRHLILFRRHAAEFNMPLPGMAVGLPDGLHNLTNLQTLKYITPDKKTARSLACLEQMRSLELSGVDASCAIDLPSSISKMRYLLRLGISSYDEDTVLDLESVDQPPRSLQKLALTGSLARGKLPSWTFSLTNLKQLHLRSCGIAQDSLALVASLPGLLLLSLTATYRENTMTFPGGCFPALKTLILCDLPNLCHIEFQRGCLSELHQWVLDRCTQITETPQGMENLTSLNSLKLLGMEKKFAEKLDKERGEAGYQITCDGNRTGWTQADSEFRQLGPSRYLRWVQRTKWLSAS